MGINNNSNFFKEILYIDVLSIKKVFIFNVQKSLFLKEDPIKQKANGRI